MTPARNTPSTTHPHSPPAHTHLVVRHVIARVHAGPAALVGLAGSSNMAAAAGGCNLGTHNTAAPGRGSRSGLIRAIRHMLGNNVGLCTCECSISCNPNHHHQDADRYTAYSAFWRVAGAWIGSAVAVAQPGVTLVCVCCIIQRDSSNCGCIPEWSVWWGPQRWTCNARGTGGTLVGDLLSHRMGPHTGIGELIMLLVYLPSIAERLCGKALQKLKALQKAEIRVSENPGIGDKRSKLPNKSLNAPWRPFACFPIEASYCDMAYPR